VLAVRVPGVSPSSALPLLPLPLPLPLSSLGGSRVRERAVGKTSDPVSYPRTAGEG